MPKPTNIVADIKEEIKAAITAKLLEETDKQQSESDLVNTIKTYLDNTYYPSWHVIVGKSFGSTVTHEAKAFYTCKIGELNVLIYKAGVL
ncbi:Dynein light chain [Spironucleus salmonicida]|uniref:Dynein light chain n=1 Tax=Spironucleus salmonicida TaxID=348837 RepID=V6M0G0_9EUKA|nr:Dynein light chain [Spironucleus salmonicida]|eukprot:EST46619.1 Dynein light chain [Spironucleus salmonicida]